jgi:hypothetical protein
LLDQIASQKIVDPAEPANTQIMAVFMKHAHVRQLALVGKVGECTPPTLF